MAFRALGPTHQGRFKGAQTLSGALISPGAEVPLLGTRDSGSLASLRLPQQG